MKKRRFERITVLILSGALLLSTTGLFQSLAANADEYSSVSSSSSVTSESATSTTATPVSSTVNNDSQTEDGTASNPYKISDATGFIGMQSIINSADSKDKYFVLDADIDLSGISADYIAHNGGSLVTVNKAAASASKNVYFVLDGNGHKLTGLNVSAAGSVSIFGYINPLSVVQNLVISNPVISVSADSVQSVAVVAAENEGTINKVTVDNPVLTFKTCTTAGIVAAVNKGTISNVTINGKQNNVSAATAELHTISGSGTIGAVAGNNSGKIVSVSALHIGMYMNNAAKTVYGGIVGSNSGTVSNSVSTGNVKGGKFSDFAGGIAGWADEKSVLDNNYTLVAMSTSAYSCAVLGAGGNAKMVESCYWSSEISKCRMMIPDYRNSDNDFNKTAFKIIGVGESFKVSSNDANCSWGKASFALLASDYSASGDGISADDSVFKAEKADTVNYIKYTSNITLPSSVGSGTESVKLTQRMYIPVLVAQTSAEKGTAKAPFLVRNSMEMKMLAFAPGIYAKLDKNATVSFTAFSFDGTLDGNGNTLTVTAPVFNTVYGTVKNLTVAVKSDLSDALFGRAVSADVDSVKIYMTDGCKLNVASSNTGVLFDTIAGETVIDNTNVKADINVTADSSNIGSIAGSVVGDNTKISNTSAYTNITADNGVKVANVANFIGLVGAKDVSVSNSSVSGKNSAGAYSFVGAVSAESMSVHKIYMTEGMQSGMDFASYGFADKAQFIEWKYGNNNTAFFTGNGGSFGIALPSISAFDSANKNEFALSYDGTKLNASVDVKDGKAVLNVSRAADVITLKAVPVTVTSKTTGLSITLVVSNGLEKNADGKYIISTGYDFAYVSENINELKNSDFVLNSDIDMSVINNFVPIGGTVASFSGKLDGNGHKVQNLNVNSGAMSGLFGSLNGATISNIVIEKATVNSKGSHTGVLAGQIKNSTIQTVSIINSTVKSADIYSGVLAGSVSGGTVKGISIYDSAVNSTANYVGAVAGYATEKSSVSNIDITRFTATAAEYVSGVVGLCNNGTAISDVSVNNATIKGTSEVSGIASGNTADTAIKNVSVKASDIRTYADTSSFVAGGISASFGAVIENATVESSKIEAGTVGGIVGKTVTNGNLSIVNSTVKSTQISAVGTNTVAAGILGVHNTKGTAKVSGCYADSDVIISAAALTSGVVGDFLSSDSKLIIENSTTAAVVKGCESTDAVAVGGVLGRIGISSVNDVTIIKVNSIGQISGCGALGGIVGLVKDGIAFNGASPIISDCISACAITPSNTQTEGCSGVIIGSVSKAKALNNGNINSALSNLTISTYFGAIPAFGTESALSSTKYYDMDKPNGHAIQSNVTELKDNSETSVEITNLPSVKGFVFDKNTGWVSESDDRVEVIRSTENTAVLKANHMADISIVGYYVLESDSNVRVPVHFEIKSDVRIPLKGNGTKDNPYLVANAYDLETVSQYDTKGKVFALSEDITFSEDDFVFGGAFYNVGNGIITIGNAESGFKGTFTGLYNGTVHKINGLKIKGNTFGGLFGATDGANINNLIINDAEIAGFNYAGVIAGNSVDTTISNVTITSSTAKTTEFGGITGTVVGNAENTTINNVTIGNSSAETSLLASSATVEAAGGIAGRFSGEIKATELKSVSVNSGAIAGGAVGIAAGALNISDVRINADVKSEISGGVAGKIENPLKVTVSDALINGSVYGEKVSGGVFGEIAGDYSLSDAKNSLLSNVVVATNVTGKALKGAVVGNANEKTFVDKENSKTDIFDNVYYSSYQNDAGIFGNEALNTYQTDEYAVYDLNKVKFISGSQESDKIKFNSDSLVLSDDNMRISGVDGNIQMFTVAGYKSSLSDVKSNVNNLISYDKSASTIKLNNVAPASAKVEFVYDTGLVVAIGIYQNDSLSGKGTESSPYLINNADDFALMMQSNTAGTYYCLTENINLSDVKSADNFAGILNGNGKVLYDYSGESLFNSVTGTISNLGIQGFNISSENQVSLGALASVLNGATVHNCYVIADISAGKNVQDAGILAGRIVNGASVESVVTSGRVVSQNAIALGGIVGLSIDSKISESLSTAYVNSAGVAGGIVGSAEKTALNNVIFANMVESKSDKCGNIAGLIDNNSSVNNAYFDTNTVRSEKAFDSGDFSATGLNTDKLNATKVDGFKFSDNGYGFPGEMNRTSFSDMFKTGYVFATSVITYMSGLNTGTARSYTDINVPSAIGGYNVSIDRSAGLRITLENGNANPISRYANPVSSGTVNVTYSIVDATKDLSISDSVIGVLLKSKLSGESNSFSFFTKPEAENKIINGVYISDNEIYVDMVLPQGYGFTVIGRNGNNNLKVTDAGRNGYLINTDYADEIEIEITIKDEETPWGIRSIWSALTK